jgi:hypothetical protein
MSSNSRAGRHLLSKLARRRIAGGEQRSRELGTTIGHFQDRSRYEVFRLRSSDRNSENVESNCICGAARGPTPFQGGRLKTRNPLKAWALHGESRTVPTAPYCECSYSYGSFTACINITEGRNYVETREDLIIGDVRLSSFS